ncbi:CD99 molecule isoform 1-T1 [Lycodopsis pacificus]
MELCLRIALLLLLVTGTLTEEEPTPAKPKEQPKVPVKSDSDGGLDLWDALGSEEPPAPTPKKPSSGDSGGFGLDLEDALGPGNEDPYSKPDKPAVKPPNSGGGGGSFDLSDLEDVSGGDYKPDGGRPGGGGASDSGYDQGGADQPQEAGPGKIAGIASAIGVALLGAVTSYVAYQKKKLCFKLQGGADPESGKGHHGTRSDPQVFSNLLRTS